MADDALSVAVDLGQRLEAAGIPYAIGEALALGAHGASRATSDVDLNVFVDLTRLDETFDALEQASIAIDRPKLRAEAERDGVFFCWAGPTRVDVFLPSIDLAWEAQRARVQFVISRKPTWFLSVEFLACFKLLFFRPKDLTDLERLVDVNRTIDVARVRSLIAAAMEEDDERVRAWDDIVRRFGAA